MFALYLSHPKEPGESVVLPLLTQLPLPIYIHKRRAEGSVYMPLQLYGVPFV